MDNPVSFGSHRYLLMLGLLVFGRGMDFLSTWTATPNLALEGNPIAKKLGWKWGLSLNAVVVVVLAMWPLSALVITTASVLVAARNFQSAWLMRSLGEDAYREWHVQRIRETPVTLHLSCLAGNTLLIALVGAALIGFSRMRLVPFGIGMGMVAYAIAVAFYSVLAIWRIHRTIKREAYRLQLAKNQPPATPSLAVETYSRPPDRIV
ncbi:MAG: hypothetical protein ABSC24_03980 [Verrucomicrobiota bacterium]|jgi:hypothetical protein